MKHCPLAAHAHPHPLPVILHPPLQTMSPAHGAPPEEGKGIGSNCGKHSGGITGPKSTEKFLSKNNSRARIFWGKARPAMLTSVFFNAHQGDAYLQSHATTVIVFCRPLVRPICTSYRL